MLKECGGEGKNECWRETLPDERDYGLREIG